MVKNKSDKFCCPAASFVDKPCENNVYKQFQLKPNQKLLHCRGCTSLSHHTLDKLGSRCCA